MRDVEADLVVALVSLPSVTASGVDAVDIEAGSPFVQVTELPSQEAERFSNGPRRSLYDLVDVDLDVYASTLDAAFDTAQAVREWLLSGAPGLPFTPVQVPVFARRPDYNERIRRRGAAVTFRVRSDN
ncbi:hypothetical protein NCCP2495_05420 [Dietzia sp. NCCP-2495]|uniref:hypothetical protein n=1 Tax=Dietzia sp. NCCP-2495 TaxID=2934675 RepID=UPI00223172D5|nr:hypothetical protein [Dietzia sp. NCCP-2495]GLB62664.1 hypothetical protein NCCP2495_05420 [Dietzia sp. NCCP-2495]